MNDTLLRSLRLTLASLITVALVAQVFIGLSRGPFSFVRFFSYFTVLSNTSAVVMLTMLAARPRRDLLQGFAVFRGAVTVYMTVTGLVYAFILLPAGIDVGVVEPWIDWSIHVIGPIGIAVDWIVNRPQVSLPQSAPFVWLVFPAVYLTYTLIRGSFVEWYPYPILDPVETGGYGGVALWSLVILAIILGFSYAYLWWAGRPKAEKVAG